jgi:hypothetical protein
MGANSTHKNNFVNYKKVISVGGTVEDVWFENNLTLIFTQNPAFA